MAGQISLDNRSDLSNSIMHLTKASSDGTTTTTARENLLRILKSGVIEARSYHSLFKKELSGLPANVQSLFHVVCFSEAPLTMVKFLTIPERKTSIKLEPYGVFFTRQDMIDDYRGNPAIYVTKTYTNDEYDRFRAWVGAGARKPTGTLPLVNLFSEVYDFTWEREWRTVGHCRFHGVGGVRGIILPPEGDDDLAALFAKHTTPVVRSGMTEGEIDQQLKLPGARDKAAFWQEMSSF